MFKIMVQIRLRFNMPDLLKIISQDKSSRNNNEDDECLQREIADLVQIIENILEKRFRRFIDSIQLRQN